MLRLTRPGNSKNFYCGGTVSVGGKKKVIRRHSTGLSEKSKAESYRAKLQIETEEELLYGKQGRSLERVTVKHACDQWVAIKNPKGAQVSIASQIVKRLGKNSILQDFSTPDWQKYRAEHLQRRAPATVQMHKAIIRAFFHAVGITPPEMQAPKIGAPKEVKLSIEDADRLMNEYPTFIRGPAKFARYGGMRANEVARLQFEHINWNTLEVELPASLNKNARPRSIPMHPQMIAVAQTALKQFETGLVFRKPITVTNAEGKDEIKWIAFEYDEYSKNNPFQNFHNSARKRAGLEYFRWHDWRHHWAFMCVEGGMDIRTLQKIGGWSSLEMVAKYLAPNYEKAREVLKVMK